MKPPVMSRDVGKEIVEALGLPGVVTSVELHFKADQPVVALVTLMPDIDAARKCIAVVRRLTLYEISNEK